MSSTKTLTLAAALSVLISISHVSAHGFVSGIVIGGEYYPGFDPSAAPYQKPPPPVIGWPNGASDTGFVTPQAYGSRDIICHLSSRPGEKHATVAAGSSIDLQWNQWDVSHHGPVIDYMAKCDGECEKADPSGLKFFKIDEAGLRNGSPAPGLWATDDLRANNLTWTVTVPASIAPGNYVLRHELIALHSADKPYGAQNYPQCINLEVTGSGTENPVGIPATEFYTPTDPGISLSIYYPALENYTIPGPPLFSGAQTGGNTPSPASSSSVPVSSSTVDSTEPTSAPEYASSVVSPMEPSMTTTPVYQNSATAADEQTSTTTTQTTATMTTTVEPGSTPTDMSYSSSEVEAAPTSSTEVSPMPSETEGYGYPSSEVEAVPTSSAEAIPTTPGMDDYASPTIVKEYGSEVTPPPSEPSPSSPAATSPTDAVPSPVETSTTPTASEPAEDSGNGMPVTKSLAEFVEWLKKLLEKYFNADGSRKHARDLAVM